jgi:hypothetical protein
MQRRRFSFPRCCCALLCCAVVVLFSSSTRSPPHAVLLATDLSLSVVVRVLGVGARATWVCWCWVLCCRGALVLSPSSQSPASRWCAGAAKAGLFACVVRPGLVGVDAAEHLVPSCSVHYDVLPCRGWDLAEEEVNEEQMMRV